MKRMISLLAAALIALSFAGCGDKTPVAAPLEASPSVSVYEPDIPSVYTAEKEAEEKEEPPYDNNWQFGAPEAHGARLAKLEAFHAEVSAAGIFCALTVKDGVIIDEYYEEGYDEDSVFRFASCTKSLTGMIIGIAIEQGFISGVDAKLSEFFPQFLGTDKETITIEHLLGHVSGIYWREWSGGPMFRQLSSSENWLEFVFSQPMEAAPGTFFNYTTGGSHLLAAIIQEATGETANNFAERHLFIPLGMDSVQWRSDPQGITDGGNGVSMTARDAAKLGQLYLDGGSWRDKQIIPRQWVEESTKRQFAGSPCTGEYGYSWWLHELSGYDVYYAMGAGGQYIFVVPDLNLVTVMAARLRDTYLPQRIFRDHLLTAFL